MASQPDVFQQCLEQAASASQPALEHALDQAVAALQGLETQSQKFADRDALANAWRQLQEHKAGWLARFPQDLKAAFAQSVAAAAQNSPLASHKKTTPAAAARVSPSAVSPAATRSASLGLDAFSLVDDAEVNQAIASQRLLQHLLPAVEQALTELDALISSAQGLPNVRPDLNPLRPEIFARSLQDLLASSLTPAQSDANAALLALWLKTLAQPFARELKSIYEKITHLMEAARVPAAQYRVLQTPAQAAGRGAGANAAQAGRSGAAGSNAAAGADRQAAKVPSQYADLSNHDIQDELFQDFLFRGGSNAHHGLAPAYYATVDKELADLGALSESAPAPLGASAHAGLSSEQAAYQAAPAVDRPRRMVDVSSPLSAKLWGPYARPRDRALVRTLLKKEATQVGQVLGLEVVRKLVNQVAQDPRLLVPVREAIVALEPSLLRLAMVDPRFFSDEGHPGRRLMERVAQRSFKYNDEYSADFSAFFAAVTLAFNALNHLRIDDAKPFGMALATLEHQWDEQDQRDFDRRRVVLKALHFAEDRQECADQIAFDLSTRSDLDNVPGVVLDFLFGPWALAMAHAKLTDQRNQVDPEGFGSAVPDLIWSVKREVTLKRPAMLIEMIPGLLDKLHTGLAMLGQDPLENDHFFESLMTLHQPVLKLRRLKSQRDAVESGAIALEQLEQPDGDVPVATSEQRRAKAAAQPWLAREDLDAAGFEDTQPTAPGDLLPLQAQGLPAEVAPAPSCVKPAAAGVISVSSESIEIGEDRSAVEKAPAPAPSEAPAAPQPVPVPAEPTMTKEQAGAILLGLTSGSWVDLYSKRRWLRAQLIWASTKGTLFMFLSHGGQPHSMTQRSCEKLIAQRLLRPVDTHGVIAMALNAVVAGATHANGQD